MTYIFKITKNKLSLSLSSDNKNLIADEFGKFAAAFVGVEYIPQKILSIKSEEQMDITSILPTEEKISQNDKEENAVTEDAQTLEASNTTKNVLPANFAKVLAAKTKETTSNVVEKRISELKNTYLQMQNTIREKNLKTEVDYVVAAAYCLSQYENRMSFTQEDINAKIAPFFDEELDHNYILDAVDKNFIKVLPDFTGFSDTIEFELTEFGEEYFINEL